MSLLGSLSLFRELFASATTIRTYSADQRQERNMAPDPVKPNHVPASFFGRYKLSTSENFDTFLREIGVGLMKRKLADSSYPTVEFHKDENDNFIFKSHTIIKSTETRFRLGEEFDEDRLDGKKVKSLVVAEGNKFIQIQRDGDQEIKYIREFGNDEIRVTSIVNNVTCLRIYKRIPEQWHQAPTHWPSKH